MKWGGKRRYTLIENVRFLGYEFTVPDLQTFIGQFQEIFVEECYRFNTQASEPLIIDCGANIGLSCLFYNKNYPKSRIIAFEADPKIFPILKRNLLNNNINNVELVDKAVWINDGEIDFAAEGSDGGSIYGSLNLTRIKCIRLKDYLETYSHIDFLKIDIEGPEDKVIEDCRYSLHNVDNIFVEYHSWKQNGQKLGDILSVLQLNEFRYFLEVPTKRRSPLLNQGNNLTIDMHVNIYGWRKHHSRTGH